MAEIVEADKSGRIVIPKKVRKDLGISENTKFILAKKGQGQILLQKLDVKEIAERLERELAGKDIDDIVRELRKELNEKVRSKYTDLLT
jgi:AbrB family looped-hinge helix DNA binding protein